MKKAFLIFISFFSFIYLDGQVTTFGENPAEYISTLQKLFSSDRNLSKSDMKNIDVFLLGDFSSFWGSITDLEKKSIINLSNQMLKKRLGTDYFLAFIHSLVNIQKSGKWQSDFTDWAKTYDNIINNFNVLGTITADYQSFIVSLKRLNKISSLSSSVAK